MGSEEWEWEALSATALAAYEAAQRDEASHLWRRAGDLAGAFAGNDPRRATSVNNAAIGLLLEGRIDDARTAFTDALGRWEAGPSWIETMDIAVGARSSLFHLRMEQRHTESYLVFRRARHTDLLRGAAALTTFNLALAQYHLECDDDADRLLEESIAVRRATWGARDPDLATLLAVRAGRLETLDRPDEAETLSAEARKIVDEPARGALELWHAERPRELCDERRLLSAAYLTAAVHQRDVM